MLIRQHNNRHLVRNALASSILVLRHPGCDCLVIVGGLSRARGLRGLRAGCGEESGVAERVMADFESRHINFF